MTQVGLSVLSSRARRRLLSLAIAGTVSALGGALFGPPGFGVAAAAALIFVAARHDNHLGTWLPLAILFVLACGMLALLLALMSFAAPR